MSISLGGYRSIAAVGVLAITASWALDNVGITPDPPLPLSYRVVDGRQILADDKAGPGRVVEAFGDLRRAEHIAVFVPGASWKRANFVSWKDRMSPRKASRTLLAEARRQDPDARVAAIAWLGYYPPGGLDIDALRSERAIAGARELTRLTKFLPRKAHVTLVCHSYGSVVCGRAARTARVDEIVVVGATGMDAESARDLDTSARIWAAQTDDDGMRFLPQIRIAGLGHRTSPTSPSFGAHRFDTGKAWGHSRYYEPGGTPMRNITRITLGTMSLGGSSGDKADSRV